MRLGYLYSRYPVLSQTFCDTEMLELGNAELLCEICAGAEFVGAETDFSRDLLAAQCQESADKIFRIYNGIALRKFEAAAPEISTSGPVRLLSVGRLVQFKGFDV